MEMHKKLKFTEKLSYGIADLPEAANSIIAAFLTMFYTDNIGLAAAAVGTMFFISKLFDGISDILAGILIVIIVTSLTLVGTYRIVNCIDLLYPARWVKDHADDLRIRYV